MEAVRAVSTSAAQSTAVPSATDFRARAPKSVLLDRAYDHYCELVESGTAVEPREFVEQYPDLKRSLLMLLDVHRFVQENEIVSKPDAAHAWPTPGTTLGNFALIEELGRGALSRVYLARELPLGGRLVAVKVVDQERREAERIARLRHPNIVPIHSIQRDQESGRWMICMPFRGRATLCDVLDFIADNGTPALAGPLLAHLESAAAAPADSTPRRPERTYLDLVIRIGMQLADGLAHSHANGVCHNDIKPSNVLLVAGGEPILLDFNLAGELDDPFCAGGTLPYMAPERLVSLSRESEQLAAGGERSDIFSLGVLLYELLTGELPFGGFGKSLDLRATAKQLLQRQQDGFVPIRRRNARVDREISQLVERCLSIDPNDRPQSATGLATALKRSLSLSSKGKRWAKAHRVATTTMALFLAGSISWLGLALATRPSADQRELASAISHYDQKDYPAAILASTRALDLNPELHEAYRIRAYAHQTQGQYSAAIDDFRLLLGKGKDAEVRANIAYCSAITGYHHAAIIEANTSQLNGFCNAPLLSNLANCYRAVGRYGDAIDTATKAIQLEPTFQPSYLARALAILSNRLNDPKVSLDPACRDLEKALELGPVSGQLYFNAAWVLSLQPDPPVKKIRDYLTNALALQYSKQNIKLHPQLSQYVDWKAPIPPQRGLKMAHLFVPPSSF
jgi:serine/threonine protein kinase